MLPWGAASALLAWGLAFRRYARGRAARKTAAGCTRFCLLPLSVGIGKIGIYVLPSLRVSINS